MTTTLTSLMETVGFMELGAGQLVCMHVCVQRYRYRYRYRYIDMTLAASMAVVIKLICISESPGGLLKIPKLGLPSR